MGKTLYMVVEHFRNRDAVPVYQRFRDRGRMAPDGLAYVSSWVDAELARCYQVMETDDPALLDRWIANWSDIVDFEVHPVISSKEAAERAALKPLRDPQTDRHQVPAAVNHALALRFDAEGEGRINRLWDRLVTCGFPVRPRTAGAPPHVSLGVSEGLNVETLSRELAALGSPLPAFALRFSSIGLFPSAEGVVFLAPVVSEALLAFHSQVYPMFLRAATGPRACYAPGAWVPHCTIDYGLTPRDVSREASACCSALETIEARTAGLSAIRGAPDAVEVLASWPS